MTYAKRSAGKRTPVQTAGGSRRASPNPALNFLADSAQGSPIVQRIAQMTRGFASDTVVQRNITMKDGGNARRTSGSNYALRQEVQDVIRRGDQTEMNSDISKLTQSVQAREDGQFFFKKNGQGNTEKYGMEQVRLDLERELLRDLRQAERAAFPPPRRETRKKPDKGGGGGGNPYANNPYAALMDM